MKVLIIDFYDSFTYNCASILYELGISSKVIGFDKIKELPKEEIIILGPGPGSPNDYQEIFPLVQSLLSDPTKFIMGICLGHQLIWQLKGHNLISSKEPIHGRQIKCTIPAWPEFEKGQWGKKVSVQRYNSLAIKVSHTNPDIVSEGAEMLMGRFSNGLSYQFHPESVGTHDSALFFSPIRKLCQQKLELMESTI